MNEREKEAAFNKARAAQLKKGVAIQRDTAAEIRRQLKQAETDIATALKKAPSDYRQFHLTELQKSVRQALAKFEPGATAALHNGLDLLWQGGQALIDAPLAAVGIDLTGHLVAIDTRKLEALRKVLTHKAKDITTNLADRINAELGATAIGTQTPFQAAEKVAGILETGGMERAHTLVRTELGRAFSAAAQDRQEQAVKVVPGMKKQWRRSGKLHSRFSHDAIDGQIRDVDKPFDLDGVKLMYPRDPNGPIAETINCGCSSIPFMASWTVIQPGRRPFTAEEIAGSRAKRDLDSGF